MCAQCCDVCVIQAIDNLDADVLTIENSRSGNEMIVALAKYGYKKDVGPGVYDVHSPVVPRCVQNHLATDLLLFVVQYGLHQQHEAEHRLHLIISC